jgi:hypothetical protein
LKCYRFVTIQNSLPSSVIKFNPHSIRFQGRVINAR